MKWGRTALEVFYNRRSVAKVIFTKVDRVPWLSINREVNVGKINRSSRTCKY